MKPIYIHSGMAGSPQYANANGNINAILETCLVNGFNTKTATSASASGGVLTLNFSADPGFEALQTVEVAVSAVAMVNGQHRVVSNANNQVTIAIAGLPDGAVGSSGAGITIKQAGAGWSKPYGNTTTAVFRPPAGNRRYLRCVHAVNTNFTARGYETMTAISTGTGLFPTTAQEATPMVAQNIGYGADVGSLWFVIATDKWMIFSLSNVPSNDAAYALGCFFFGDIAEKVKAGDAYSTLFGGGVFQKYLNRNHAGSAASATIAIAATPESSESWPSVINDGVRFIPYVTVHQSDYVLRGILPNAYRIYPHTPSHIFLDIYSNVANVTGRLKPIGWSGWTNPMPIAIAIDEETWV